jgi:hypothetical protein
MKTPTQSRSSASSPYTSAAPARQRVSLSRKNRRCLAAVFIVVFPQVPLAAEVALDISVSGADVQLFWPAMSQSHALESSPDLAGPWTPVTQIPAIVGERKELIFSRSVPRYFFRLSYPLEAGPDLPDGTFTDTNGDGIDGDLGNAVFVAPAGLDAAGYGLVPTNSCRTISFGIAQAVATGRAGVYVQAGTYPEMVNLAGGIGVYGGFDSHWLRAPNDTPGHTVLVTGMPGTSEAIAVKASNLTAMAVAADLEIHAPNATGAVAGIGRSSYGIFVSASPVTLDRLVIFAGNGADGAAGAAGVNASATAAASGSKGGTAGTVSWVDYTTRGSGGAAGIQTSFSGRNPNGGTGGAGGTADTATFDYDATRGLNGTNAADWTTGGFGWRGDGGPANSTVPGYPGNPGQTVDGHNGYGGSSGWFYGAGSNGTLGDNGTGGGGGGGSGGNDTGFDSYGAGGGGGGAGGLRAPAAGTGGGGGGASIGVFITGASTVSITTTISTLGNGGRGGNGGNGAQGQPGGTGGLGGNAADDSQRGGNGGNGARGGHSGSGGGGAGGGSAGILRQSLATLNTNDVTYSGGTAGAGGAGGSSPIGSGYQGDPGLIQTSATF